MPSSLARSAFDPGFSPTTTRSVLLETVPLTFAPRAISLAFAFSLLRPDNEPVNTTVLPRSGELEVADTLPADH